MHYMTGPEVQEWIKGMTRGDQAKVAAAVGMTQQALSRLKMSKKPNPTWKTIQRLSEYKASQEELK